jgi:hypothetical protein
MNALHYSLTGFTWFISRYPYSQVLPGDTQHHIHWLFPGLAGLSREDPSGWHNLSIMSVSVFVMFPLQMADRNLQVSYHHEAYYKVL